MPTQEEITLARMANMIFNIDDFELLTLRQLESVYKDSIKSIIRDLRTLQKTSKWSQERLLLLLEEAQQMHNILQDQITVTLADGTADVGLYSYQEMNNIISWDGRITDFNAVALTKDQLIQLVTDQKLGGKTMREWVGVALEPNISEITSELRQGFIKGEGFQKTLTRLSNQLDIPRGSENYRNLESTIKTYYQSVNVQAQNDVYQANPDVVKKVEWSAVMENGNFKTGRGTCPRCMALDGNQYKVDDKNKPFMPLHIRCRCVWYPITLTWRELGFDVDEMEDVYEPWTIRNLQSQGREIMSYGSTDMNYSEWWKARNKAFQNNAIGPRRADLIRNDLISFKDIVDEKGNLIPIRDLIK